MQPDPQQYKQPYEGISGLDRDDLLLSLDEAALTHRDALIAMVRHLQTATMVGNPAPVVERMNERIRTPQPGDLVVEASRGLYARDPETRYKALGILLEKRREWWHTDEEWEAQRAEEVAAGFEPDERPTDTAWYVQYGPNAGAICRWTNCSFVTLPINVASFSEPYGVRDDRGGVTVTRTDLLASLADSGITLRTPDAA